MNSETSKGGNDSDGTITQDSVEDVEVDLTLDDEDDNDREQEDENDDR